MKYITKQNMVFSFVLLAALVLGLIVIPQDTKAQYGGYISSIPAATVRQDNPEPIIKSINPSASNVGVGTKTVNIIGEGFIPSSVARVNGSNRPTTFIDSSHLLVQITGNDTYLYQTNGGFYITVFNGPPGGGYSNAVFFKINKKKKNTPKRGGFFFFFFFSPPPKKGEKGGGLLINSPLQPPQRGGKPF